MLLYEEEHPLCVPLVLPFRECPLQHYCWITILCLSRSRVCLSVLCSVIILHTDELINQATPTLLFLTWKVEKKLIPWYLFSQSTLFITASLWVVLLWSLFGPLDYGLVMQWCCCNLFQSYGSPVIRNANRVDISWELEVIMGVNKRDNKVNW